MPTDKINFDDFLKEKLHRDLVFRGCAWITISAIASYYAIHYESADPFQFMLQTTEKTMRILNTLGVFAILLACLALLFKDLQSCDELSWGQHTKKGYIGGIVRRLAGDLTLWMLGAISTIITVICVAIFSANSPLPIKALLGIFIIVLLSWLTVISLLNIAVRREELALLTLKLKQPRLIVLAYLSFFLLFLVAISVYQAVKD